MYYSFTCYAFRDLWRRLLKVYPNRQSCSNVNNISQYLIRWQVVKKDANDNSAGILLRMYWRCMTMDACQIPKARPHWMNNIQILFTQPKAATCCNHIMSLLMSAWPLPTPIISETVFQTDHYINALWAVGVDASWWVIYRSFNHFLTFRNTNFVELLFRDSVSIMQKAHIFSLKKTCWLMYREEVVVHAFNLFGAGIIFFYFSTPCI